MKKHAERIGAVALVALSLVSLLGPPAAARSARPDAAQRAEVRAAVGPGVRVTWNRDTHVPAALSGTAARPVATAASLGSPATPSAAADAFMARHGDLFGVSGAGRGLTVSAVVPDDDRTFVRYQQTYRGLPVLAGELIVQVGPQRQIVSVAGRTSPSLDLAVRPSIGPALARRLAIAATAGQERVKASTLRASAPRLAIYDAAVTGDPRALPGGRLAWHVEVRSASGLIDEWVAIEATRGGVLAAFNQVDSALPANATQRLCDLKGQRATNNEGASDPLQCDANDPKLVAKPASSTQADVKGAFKGAQATYAFFAKRFGRNSLNGKGMPLISTVRFCPQSTLSSCPYANAFWNGVQMYYGAGFAKADDVVAHELAHGLTTFTSKLLYWFQSGAINESMSDIFGEFVDQTDGLGNDSAGVKWLLGEDLPGGAGRNMKDPGSSAQGASPDRMRSPNYTADGSLTDRGGVHYNSGVGNKAAYLITQGDTFNGQTVAGIGLDKAAALYYRVQTKLLTSGSDYTDLGAALNQACKDLLGTTPKNKSGAASASGKFTAVNCTNVGKAVLATEMALDPLVATVNHTKLCETGAPTAGPFKSTVPKDGSPWIASGTANTWYIGSWYATSKPYALWGFPGASGANASTRSPGIAIPATGTTYLVFRNYWNFQQWNFPYEGGVVEYATSTSGPWTDLGSLFVFNGYNGTISNAAGNPLGGRQAFVGFSYGFGVSKADLTSLAGQTVFIRFRVGSNNDTTTFDGWVIDDVRVYQCA